MVRAVNQKDRNQTPEKDGTMTREEWKRFEVPRMRVPVQFIGVALAVGMILGAFLEYIY